MIHNMKVKLYSHAYFFIGGWNVTFIFLKEKIVISYNIMLKLGLDNILCLGFSLSRRYRRFNNIDLRLEQAIKFTLFFKLT